MTWISLKQHILRGAGRVIIWNLRKFLWVPRSVQFSHSVMSNSLWPHVLHPASLCVHHQLQEFPQTHGHQVNDAIRPSYPLSSPSPSAFNLSQPQGLFEWVSSHQVPKILELQLQSFQLKGCCWAVKDTGILGLRRRGIRSRASDKAWSLKDFV